MSDRDPLVRLTDEITLTRDEAAVVLFALDNAELDAASEDRPAVRKAIRVNHEQALARPRRPCDGDEQ